MRDFTLPSSALRAPSPRGSLSTCSCRSLDTRHVVASTSRARDMTAGLYTSTCKEAFRGNSRCSAGPSQPLLPTFLFYSSEWFFKSPTPFMKNGNRFCGSAINTKGLFLPIAVNIIQPFASVFRQFFWYVCLIVMYQICDRNPFLFEQEIHVR